MICLTITSPLCVCKQTELPTGARDRPAVLRAAQALHPLALRGRHEAIHRAAQRSRTARAAALSGDAQTRLLCTRQRSSACSF